MRTVEGEVRFCLVFDREILSVPVMRQVLGDTLRGIGVNDESVDDILLAATEACTNVVLHAGPTAPYTVATTVDSAACRIEVTDSGSGCRTRHSRRSEAGLAESGRGFDIMRACVDNVTLSSVPGEGTQVVLDKRINWENRELVGSR